LSGGIYHDFYGNKLFGDGREVNKAEPPSSGGAAPQEPNQTPGEPDSKAGLTKK